MCFTSIHLSSAWLPVHPLPCSAIQTTIGNPIPQDRSEWALGSAFIATNDFDDLRLYIFLMRLACIPLILLGGYFGYRFASELYGQWSGVTFLIRRLHRLTQMFCHANQHQSAKIGVICG